MKYHVYTHILFLQNYVFPALFKIHESVPDSNIRVVNNFLFQFKRMKEKMVITNKKSFCC